MSSDHTPPLNCISIAIVNDEESVRIALRRLCGALGLNPAIYASGRELIDSLEAGAARPDCLLLDAHMPRMTGLELHQHLAHRGMNLPTIVYTANDAPEAQARYVATGVTVSAEAHRSRSATRRHRASHDQLRADGTLNGLNGWRLDQSPTVVLLAWV